MVSTPPYCLRFFMNVMKLEISSSLPARPSLVCSPSVGGPSTTTHFIPSLSQLSFTNVIVLASQGFSPSGGFLGLFTAPNTAICFANAILGESKLGMESENSIPASLASLGILVACWGLLILLANTLPILPMEAAAVSEAAFLIKLLRLSFITDNLMIMVSYGYDNGFVWLII